MSTNLKKSSATQSRKRDGPKERLKQTVKDCLERYQHWQKLYEDGGSDPFYTDGANLALVRNHIIYYKKQMEEACLALACDLPDVYFRALPPGSARRGTWQNRMRSGRLPGDPGCV